MVWSNRKYIQEEVENIAKLKGYTTSDIYVNNKVKMLFVCSNGHKLTIQFQSLLSQTGGCIKCSGKGKKTQEEVETIISNIGYKLGNRYLNYESPLDLTCGEGHKFKSNLKRLVYGRRCLKCVRKYPKLDDHEVENLFNSYNFIVIKDLKNYRRQYEVQCPEGHIVIMRLGHFKSRRRCPRCNDYSSKAEIELLDAIKLRYQSAVKHRELISIDNKPHIRGFEIDIFVPELNKGIEFDGTYFHSLEVLKQNRGHWPDSDIQNYHQIKDDYFFSRGIQLIHIKEEDWNTDKEKEIGKCLSFLGEINVGS